ncbi:hypothetical protein D1007_49091 [Hordeum vulgare]|nr:hypothetical protein D1007_49091 [Hordeum vulgare]
MAILLKTALVRVSSIQIMQIRVQTKGKRVWKSRYDADVSMCNALAWRMTLKHLPSYLTIMQWQYESGGISHEMERWELHGNISWNGYENAIVGRYGGCFEEGIWWVCAQAKVVRH